MLRRTLAEWDELGAEERGTFRPLEDAPASRWENSYPEGGLVLIETLRDVPAEFDPAAEPLQPSNRDHVWFSAAEARALVDSDGEGALAFVRRLARFHLVDSVRGQSLPFAPEELQEARLEVERYPADSPGEVRLRLTGSTVAVAEGPWLMGESEWTPRREYPRSVTVELAGHAVWNERLAAFTEFELVGVGTRRGRTRVNGRAKDEGPAPIGFHFALSTAGAQIPPAFVLVYDADWITPPSS